jgi:hypothetical protein
VGFVPVVRSPINDLGLIESPQIAKSSQNLVQIPSACNRIQSCGDVFRSRDSRSAVSAVIPRLPTTISFSRLSEMPSRSVALTCPNPRGLKYSSNRIFHGGIAGPSQSDSLDADFGYSRSPLWRFSRGMSRLRELLTIEHAESSPAMGAVPRPTGTTFLGSRSSPLSVRRFGTGGRTCTQVQATAAPFIGSGL